MQSLNALRGIFFPVNGNKENEKNGKSSDSLMNRIYNMAKTIFALFVTAYCVLFTFEVIKLIVGDKFYEKLTHGIGIGIGMCLPLVIVAKLGKSLLSTPDKSENTDRYVDLLVHEEKRNPSNQIILGRELEINEVISILNRREKNNVILLGIPGCGKTAIVKGLAQKIAKGELGDKWKNYEIISMNMLRLTAGTKYRGDLEDRMNKILECLKKFPKAILFVDEAHLLMTNVGGGQKSYHLGNFLKPALANGLQMICATTPIEYEQSIALDGAMSRRLNIVNVEPLDSRNTEKVLMKTKKERFEDVYQVTISDKAIKFAIECSQMEQSKTLLDATIDLLDTACSNAELKNVNVISKNDIQEIVLEKLKNLKHTA